MIRRIDDQQYMVTMQETSVRSLGREDLLEKEMATAPVFLPGKFHGRRSLVGYSPWGHKESDTTERLQCQCQCQREGEKTSGASVVSI